MKSDHMAKHMKYSEAYEPNPSVTQTQPIAMITQQQSLTLSLKNKPRRRLPEPMAPREAVGSREAYETNVVSDINT